MSPEQQEEWRQAILGDGSESPQEQWESLYTVAPEPAVYMRKTLHKSAKRLVGWGVPGWAASVWGKCAFRGWKEEHSWRTSFAIKSKCMLIGIRILAPARADGAPIYRRMLLRFLHEAYRPFADWVNRGDAVRQQEFAGVVALHELCGHPRAADRIEWVNLLVLLGEQLGDPAHSRAQADLLICFRCTEVVQIVLFTEEEQWWKATGADLAERIINQYYRAPGSATTQDRPAVNGTDAVATAFLKALESECPTPEWLPEE